MQGGRGRERRIDAVLLVHFFFFLLQVFRCAIVVLFMVFGFNASNGGVDDW